MKINLKLKKISSKNFKKFGEIISIKKSKFKNINNNYAKNYYDLTKIDISKNYGKPQLNIYNVKPRVFPMRIDMMERHPLGSQTFFPLMNCIFFAVVAPKNSYPLCNKIESFIIPPSIGITYNTGVWHYPLITNINSKFIVFDRKGPKKNLEIYNFTKDLITLNYA